MINILNIFNKFYEKIKKAQSLLVSKKQLTNFYKLKDLTNSCTFTAGSNWTISQKNVMITGNVMRTYIKAAPKAKVDEGAITNQVICTIKVPCSASSQPPFKDFYQTSANNSINGGVAIFRTASSVIENGYLSYNVSITGTHASIAAKSNIDVTVVSLVTFEPDRIMDYLNSIS